MKEKKDIIGIQFNRLFVTAHAGVVGKSHYYYCLCDCGIAKKVEKSNLVRGSIKSCGCYISELTAKRNTRHNLSYHPLARTYRGIIDRCTNPKSVKYAEYGARGITVCDRWLESIETFVADMGGKPAPDYTIDRIDNSKGYSPENCRWATKKTQTVNRSITKWIEFNGQKMCVSDWARLYGLRPTALHARLNIGWDFERAINTPIRDKKAA